MTCVVPRSPCRYFRHTVADTQSQIKSERNHIRSRYEVVICAHELILISDEIRPAHVPCWHVEAIGIGMRIGDLLFHDRNQDLRMRWDNNEEGGWYSCARSGKYPNGRPVYFAPSSSFGDDEG